ncbi:putative clathrin assembly protein At1g03050 [Castanea sativa]|uniref:putative clathrin assembly protein At1g03050 n=1 Tax=Castanea sativa TaxID=21020 RepID=UPI003F6495BC
MAPSKFRKAIGAVKDQTTISLAKVGSSNSLGDLEVAIVKATRHDEYPAEERHIREILSLTCYSRAYISSCVNTLSRRLSKTKNWVVALKTLILIQRLLSDGDPAYEQEIFFSTRRGTRLLNLSDFRDISHSNSWDYSSFIRTYALYLDERLEFRMQSRRGKRSAFAYEEDDEEASQHNQAPPRATPVREMKNELIFSRMQHLQQLLERLLACRPTGEAKNNRVVIVALYPIVKESFQIYYDITEIMGILVDRFMEQDVQDCVKIHEMFCRVGKQFDELDVFYAWSKSIGIARSSEYPELEKITRKKLEIMDEFIRDKSALAQGKKSKPQQEEQKEVPVEENVEDMNAIKALPPPEGFVETPVVEEKKEVEPIKKEEKETKIIQQEGDLLNLGEGTITSEEHADKLALALFDGGAQPTNQAPALAWEAFNDENADWESTLVQSASNLSGQKPSLPGGFDMLLLDGMYKQAETNAAIQGPGSGVSGSASSVALGSAGRPAMLALPAPATPEGSSAMTSSADPFAASLAVAPPPYVQMSDMEKKQKLLVEEQLMWQQYAKDGMQGQLGIAKMQQHNPYNMGGYTQSY